MAIVAEPRALAELAEIDPQLPQGRGERFSGYGVMGQPFATGHILALRRFPISSLGYGYTAVWHRSPAGEWTFWSDVEPRASCARFFGNAIDRVVVAPIAVRWTSPHSLTVSVGNHDLDWGVDTLLARQRDAAYPWLAANVFRPRDDGLLLGYLRRH